MKKISFTLLFFGVCGLASADNCRQVQAAVSTVAVQSYVPAAVLVPAYAAFYVPPTTNATTNSDEILLQLLQEIKGLRADLKALADPNLQGKGAPPTVQGNQDLAFVAMKKNCAACHTEPATEGAGLVLVTSGGLEAKLTEDNRVRVHNRIIRDSMPPRDSKFFPLPVEDKKTILGKFK